MTTLAPVSVALKFGFLAVLYLFLLWIVRSARREDVEGKPPRSSRALFQELRRILPPDAETAGLGLYVGRTAGVFFAVALIDACIIGASAVSLSTAYAIGDVLSMRHSLHRKPSDAKGFYAVYFGLIVVSAALVLTPGTPLGLLTNAVQTLAGVLLPSIIK